MRLWRKRSTVEEVRREDLPQEVEAPPDSQEVEAPPDSTSGLPGTAGYRRRRPTDVMPGRFTFVRPDGATTDPEKKGRRYPR
jgi:hypothetical protein